MKKILFSIIVVVLVACGSSNQKYGAETGKILDGLIESKSFEITSSWAQPLMTSAMQQLGNAGLFINGSTAGNIDISRHTNYLKMENDSVKAILPFYGERQFGGGYNNASGIEFEGIPGNLQIDSGKEGSYEIRFQINDKNSNTENYRVYIKLLSDLSSNINISSSNRSNIQYRGKVHALKDDKDK